MAKIPKNETGDPIQKELDSIKRLLILMLLKAGTTQEEIGTALGIEQGTVSKMFPARKISKFK